MGSRSDESYRTCDGWQFGDAAYCQTLFISLCVMNNSTLRVAAWRANCRVKFWVLPLFISRVVWGYRWNCAKAASWSWRTAEKVLLEENQEKSARRRIDAWNSSPNTVVSAPSINSFKRKLREVNLDRFFKLLCMEWFYCYMHLSFHFVVFLYCVVLCMCFSSILVVCWAICYLFLNK